MKCGGEGLASDYLTSSLAAFTMRSSYRPPSLQRKWNSSKSTGKDILDKKYTITLTFELVFKFFVVILANELYFYGICFSLHNMRTRLQVERSVRCGTMRAVAFQESSDHCRFAPHWCAFLHCTWWPLSICASMLNIPLTIANLGHILPVFTNLHYGDHCQSVLLRSIIKWGFCDYYSFSQSLVA